MSAMPRFHRKTAPAVRDGRVQEKNRWTRTPSCYTVRQAVPAIDRVRPGEGYRHLLLKRDVERFIDLLPHWEDISQGLDVILLDHGRYDRDGWYDCGVLAICAWEVEMVREVNPGWYDGHRDLLDRLGVPVESNASGTVTCSWTPSTARAYQLLHVFLHELGHHMDRLTTRSRVECARGEDYAEQYAWAYEEQIRERYCEEFGLPG
jgi:hypothetical protein